MYRWTTAAIVAVAGMLVMATGALAWNGGQITSVSCPEIHVKLPVENGKWLVWATDEQGKTIYSTQVPGQPFEQVVGGFWMSDDATHTGYVYAANAANLNDGKVKLPYQLTRCASPLSVPGPPGPMGPAGPAGPAGSPGQPGTNGQTNTTETTTVIHQAPRTCTSKRSYAFRVRKSYMGRRIVGVEAYEPGLNVKVVSRHGRFVVSWSTAGKKYTPGGVVRTVTVMARLANGKHVPIDGHVRLVWKYRPCLAGQDGNLNDPSAAGQGANGGS